MPTFDFINPTDLSSLAPVFPGATNPPISIVDDGVRFTLTSQASPTLLSGGITFPNGIAGPVNNLFMTGFGGGLSYSMTFTLTLQSVANPSLTMFSGAASTPAVIQLASWSGVGSWMVQYLTASGSLPPLPLPPSAPGPSGLGVPVTGQFTGVRFSFSGISPAQMSVTSLTVASVNCFCAGTLIETPEGARRVEDLETGDVVLTADGREAPIRWVGEQEINTQLMHPRLVNPVCIKADALGDGLPTTDLYLSKDHAIEIDGTLYNAGALVNGMTIYQVAQAPRDGFNYYHIDTGAHDLLVANGVRAESFLDYAGTDSFVNGEDRAPTASAAEMPLPRVSSARQVPGDLRAQLMSQGRPFQKVA